MQLLLFTSHFVYCNFFIDKREETDITLFSGTNGHWNSIHSNGISYDSFNRGGNTIFAFDLTTNAVSKKYLVFVS